MRKVLNTYDKIENFEPILISNDKKYYILNFNKVNEVSRKQVFSKGKFISSNETFPTGFATWKSMLLDYKPGLEQIKAEITEFINDKVKESIMNDFVWNGYKVYLSVENQNNYKVAYDLAVQSNGKSLPVKFKFEKNGKPFYYTFNTVTELSNFYMKVVNHINSCLEKGWELKDSIDFSIYSK